MNFRKILAISLILIALSISVTVVCAGQTNIDLGKITSSSIDVNSINERPSTPTPSIGAPTTDPQTTEYDVDYTANIQIDISNMSAENKDLLKKALDGNDATLVLNITHGNGKLSVEMHQGADMSLNGDILNIGVSSSYPSYSNSRNLTLTSVEIKTGDNHVFVAKNS